MNKCFREDCTKFAQRRGLCLTHYSRLVKVISAGSITWEDAEKAGLCLASVKSPWAKFNTNLCK